MHNDLILNWFPAYIKVTNIDSARFDNINSFFFKFQFSVIFYNFIFFPPFLYFFFFFVSLNFQIYSWRLLWNRYSALFFNHTFSPNIQRSLLILKQQIRIFPGLQFVWIFYAPFLIWIIFIKCTSSRSVKIY